LIKYDQEKYLLAKIDTYFTC